MDEIVRSPLELEDVCALGLVVAHIVFDGNEAQSAIGLFARLGEGAMKIRGAIVYDQNSSSLLTDEVGSKRDRLRAWIVGDVGVHGQVGRQGTRPDARIEERLHETSFARAGQPNQSNDCARPCEASPHRVESGFCNHARRTARRPQPHLVVQQVRGRRPLRFARLGEGAMKIRGAIVYDQGQLILAD